MAAKENPQPAHRQKELKNVNVSVAPLLIFYIDEVLVSDGLRMKNSMAPILLLFGDTTNNQNQI